ncbi:pirin family protein [Croceicoccus naphthovorans]|uniref:Pirin n=1 Tax=Croceicoccus naphthovorans TaxID=1348774 RepID=A0A0G3XHP3_9SPHN|nr:pirin family protein [Croceicoccus naphthovorans]AKM09923.1 pirin [Croceicoccus naphthovorans]MBB3990930.1 hypothetical protein [Croceicoccus naphthovorans]
MIEIRPFDGLGKANLGWLDTSFHFSFSGYHDPDRMNWGRLRVWNDDWIAPKSGFPEHPHRDMEIITYVRKGTISHRDSLGNSGATEAGDVQVMSAGTGIAHAEFNLEDEPTELFQIWIMPDRTGLPPSWGNRAFPKGGRSRQWVTLASGDAEGSGENDPLRINADARILAATLNVGETLAMPLDPARYYYLVPIDGSIDVNGKAAHSRDGIAIRRESALQITAADTVELLMVETA